MLMAKIEVPKISQSLIKNYTDYKREKQCGLLFEALYITKTHQSVPSAAMKLGIYFEYLSTGGLPRDGKIPVPETKKTKDGIVLTDDYTRAAASAALCKEMFRYYGVDIKSVGQSLSTDTMTGILDIRAEIMKKPVFIDLKYSGLIDNKWDELGWDTESLPMKDGIMIQGVHYKILGKDVLGYDDVPFFYWVFDSKNPNNGKIIKQNVDPDRIAQHRELVVQVRKKLAVDINKGFKAYPNFGRCNKPCPLRDTCKHAAQVPLVEEVSY
jgi:hypothetical protein